MNLRFFSHSLRVTLPVAGLIGLAACGDDTSESDTSDTMADSSPADVPDSSSPDSTGDTTPPSDTTPDTTADAPDTDDGPDTAADTTEDTNPGDVVTPSSARVVLVAWNGLSQNGPGRGTINASVSTGTAFAPFTSWRAGTMESPIQFGTAANLMGDIDGDGLADLVAWNGLDPNGPGRGSINAFLSTGSAFGPATTWKAGSIEAPVVFGSTANLIGDIDGDGRADLIAWSGLNPNGPSRGAISVFLSTGTGFANAATWFSGTNENPTLFGTTANLVGDVDGDGRADLIAWNGLNPSGPGRGSIQVMLSTGTGFATATTWFAGTNESPTLFGTTANLIADVNSDGRADLITWNGLNPNGPSRGSISVFLSTGTGFAAPTTWFAGTNESPTLFGTSANLAGPAAE